MQWQGAPYPNEDSKSQSFTLKLFCEPGAQNGPEFKSYDGEIAVVEWRHEQACPYKAGEEPPSHEPPSESVGSSLGWFFLVYVHSSGHRYDSADAQDLRLLIAFAAYFGLGAYYNYATYGATGYDLIPCVIFALPYSQSAHPATAIETSGEKFRTCCKTSYRTYAHLSGQDIVRAGVDIYRFKLSCGSRYDEMLCFEYLSFCF